MTIEWKVGNFNMAGSPEGPAQLRSILIQAVRAGPERHTTETLQLQFLVPAAEGGDPDHLLALALRRLQEACRALADNPPAGG